MKSIICLALSITIVNGCFSQILTKEEFQELTISLNRMRICLKPIKEFSFHSLSNEKLIELKRAFGQNKSIPKEYEQQIFIALSFFPELKNHQIEFITANIKTTMSCRPNMGSLLKRYNRSYTIMIDSDDEGEGVLLHDVPFNAQIGVIGHELSHIIDYENRGFQNITRLGFDYAKGHSIPEFEKSVDTLTIERGLGWQLYAWAHFVLHESNASKAYKSFKQLTYLIPEEIETLIRQNPLY